MPKSQRKDVSSTGPSAIPRLRGIAITTVSVRTVVLLALISTAPSCSSNKGLSREEVAKLINNADAHALLNDWGVTLPFPGVMSLGHEEPEPGEYLVRALEALGYVALTPSESRPPYVSARTGIAARLVEYELTATGREAANSWLPSGTTTGVSVPVWRQEVVDVTGITEESEGKGRLVEYTYRWVLTPIGEEIDRIDGISKLNAPPDEPQRRRCRLMMYDDGWRVKNY